MPSPQDTFYSYDAYGCVIHSDIPFAQLLPAAGLFTSTITVRRCDSFPEQPSDARQIGPFAKAARNYLYLKIDKLLELEARDGTTLLYRPCEGADQTSLQVFLLGSGLGALLIQRDLLVMHANAVDIDGSCVLCVGPSGIGKSTTAAGLMHRGFRVISDDVCAVNAAGQIIPGIPHIKLWQEAADTLKVETQGLSRIRPELEKFRVPMGDAFCADPMSVSRIYVLSPHLSEEVTCEAVKGQHKFLALRGNTYRKSFVDGMGMKARHFQQLVALSQHIIVKRIRRPKSGFHLDRLLDVLIADARTQDDPK